MLIILLSWSDHFFATYCSCLYQHECLVTIVYMAMHINKNSILYSWRKKNRSNRIIFLINQVSANFNIINFCSRLSVPRTAAYCEWTHHSLSTTTRITHRSNANCCNWFGLIKLEFISKILGPVIIWLGNYGSTVDRTASIVFHKHWWDWNLGLHRAEKIAL